MNNRPFIDLIFSPQDAERITGVVRTTQRDWRRHNYLPFHTGLARFEPVDLAEMWAYKLLGDRGIGPSRASLVASTIGTQIINHTFKYSDAFDRDITSIPWVQSEAESAWKYFVWLPDGQHILCDSLDQGLADPRYKQGQADPNFAPGALIVLDLEELAGVFVSRAGQLFKVKQ